MLAEAQQTRQRPAWNTGRIIGPKPPLKPRHIWAIRTRLQHERRVRDLAMFNLAFDSKLRGCDLVRLRVANVVLGGTVRLRTSIIQQKTGRPVPFGLTDPTREALTAWLRGRAAATGDWLFSSRSRPGDHVTTRQYGRLLDGWVALIGLDPALYGTHSLRRTKVALITSAPATFAPASCCLGTRSWKAPSDTSVSKLMML